MHAPNPDGLYDDILGGAEYDACNPRAPVKGSGVPIRNSVIDTVVDSYHGKTGAVDVDAPDGTAHVVSGEGSVPAKEELINQLQDAAKSLSPHPVATLDNLFGVHLGSLHYTNGAAHYVVGDEIYQGDRQRGTGELPDEFNRLGVKLAHTIEGFRIAEQKPYHWKDDLPWSETQHEQTKRYEGDIKDSDELSCPPPVSNCWVINVESAFPAQRLGQALNTPAETTTQLIKRTERLLEETLLSKRQAQYTALKLAKQALIDSRHDYDESHDMEFDEIVKSAFDLSDSGYRSLTSNVEQRKREAFQTVRRLSESDEFNYVMAEFAETIDELGRLASLGAKHRREQGKPPGFY